MTIETTSAMREFARGVLALSTAGFGASGDPSPVLELVVSARAGRALGIAEGETAEVLGVRVRVWHGC